MRLSAEKRQLKITDLALAKAQKYARLVDDIFGPQECIGFLAGDANSDIIDTVVLSPRQEVSPSRAEIDGSGVLSAGRELQRLGKQAKGWWHSHGRLPPFHSATDDANTADLLNQIGHVQWTYIKERLMRVDSVPDGTVRLINDSNEVVELQLDPALAAQLNQTPIQATHKVPVSIAYSLVVNAHNDPPYAELHTRAWCKQTQTTQLSKQTVPVIVVDSWHEETLRQEIRAKVHVKRAAVTSSAPPPSAAKADHPTTWHRLTALLPMLALLLPPHRG